jgi:hypothetical protein
MGALAWFLGCSPAAHAGISHDPSLTWNSLRSPHFVVHFHDGEEGLARVSIGIAEQVHAHLSRQLNWSPLEPTDIVLTDGIDLSNGYAQVVPANVINIFVNPPDSINGLEDHGSWLTTVITHEYVHILHLDKARAAPRVLRNVFGRNFLLFPNIFQPSWLIEGIATYAETDTLHGHGRGQSAYFNMLMREESRNGIKPISQVNQPITTWPGGSTAYLYGVQFHNFIAERQGPQKIPQLVENYSNNIIPFFVNSNSRRVLGKGVKQLWPEFDQYIGEKYSGQLAAIQARGVRQGTRITQHGYYTGASRVLPDGTLVYLRSDGRSEPALMVLRPGQERAEHLVDVHTSARFDVHAGAGILLVQPEVFRNASFYYDLYRVDLHNGRTRRLTHGARYHFAAWSPDGNSIVASREALGVSSLLLLTPDGKPQETLWTGVDSEVIMDISWSPDGASLVAAVWRPVNGWNLEMFSLASRQWTALTRDKAIEAHPQFSADGASVLFVSDHDDVYNVRRIYLADRRITTLTNLEGGAFRPSQAAAQGPLYYTGVGVDGFDLYRMDAIEEVPLSVTAAATAQTPAADAAPLADIKVEKYSPYSGLRPRWWLPHIAVESGRTELGVVTSASDPLNRHIYTADVAYDFHNDWLVGDLNYVYDRWYPIFKLRAARYNTIDLDNDDEPLRVRRSDTFQAEVVLPWLSYNHRWSLHTSALQVKDTDGWVAGGTPMLPDLTDNILGLALVFDSTRRYPLSISRSNGRHVQLVSENSDVLGESDYTGEVYSADWREFLALGNEHVLALRLAGGWGTGQARPFRLGGSRSALWAPPLLEGLDFSSTFNQRDYALRGYSTGRTGLTGRRMALSSLEWRFPVRRVERGIMAPPLALHQVFGSVFIDAGSAWDAGDRPEHYFTGAGVEANADTILFYNTGLNLRLGYAHGFNEGGDNKIYLRAGASF